MAEPVHPRFGYVRDDRETSCHVAIKCTVAHAQFALVAGGEHDGAELIRQRHQQSAACPRLNVLFGDVFFPATKHLFEGLFIRCVNAIDGKQFETDSEIFRQRTRVINRTRRRIRPGHSDSDYILRTDRLGGDYGGESTISPSARSEYRLS